MPRERNDPAQRWRQVEPAREDSFAAARRAEEWLADRGILRSTPRGQESRQMTAQEQTDLQAFMRSGKANVKRVNPVPVQRPRRRLSTENPPAIREDPDPRKRVSGTTVY